MLGCMRNGGRNKNGIVEHENGRKGGWIENCGNRVSLILKIGPKTFINVGFGLHHNPNPSH